MKPKKDYMNGKMKLLINKIILKIQIKLSPIEMNMYLLKNSIIIFNFLMWEDLILEKKHPMKEK